jgi:hypothetical protein
LEADKHLFEKGILQAIGYKEFYPLFIEMKPHLSGDKSVEDQA